MKYAILNYKGQDIYVRKEKDFIYVEKAPSEFGITHCSFNSVEEITAEIIENLAFLEWVAVEREKDIEEYIRFEQESNFMFSSNQTVESK